MDCVDRKGGVVAGTIFVILVLIGIVTLVTVVWTMEMLKPVNLGDKPVSITVKKGMTGQDLAYELERRGVIRSALVFRFFLRLRGQGREIKAGDYLLKGNLDPDALLVRLVRGEDRMLRLTIPEGYTAAQVIKLLQSSELQDAATASEVIATANPQTWGFSLDTIEGMLFPETYFYTSTTTVKQVLDRMAGGFRRHLPENLSDCLQEIGLSTLQEAITLASIVEREGKRDNERPLIASVFLNRLQKGIPLESCATVQYARGEWSARLLYKDLEINSPWNTYKNKGLPPTPIGSPGAASLNAVFHPEKSEYLYFVAKEDGSGAHHFSSNYKGHLQGIRDLKQNRRERKK